jgi:hypothetical protein
MPRAGLAAGIMTAILVTLVMGCAWPSSADAVQVAAPGASVRAESMVEGAVVAVTSSIRRTEDGRTEGPSVSLLLRVDGELLSVAVAEGARVVAADGRAIDPNEIPLSARVRAEGQPISPTQFEAALVEVLP